MNPTGYNIFDLFGSFASWWRTHWSLSGEYTSILWTHLIFINFGVESFRGKKFMHIKRNTWQSNWYRMISNMQGLLKPAIPKLQAARLRLRVASTTQVRISVKCHREALAWGPTIRCRDHVQPSTRDQMHFFRIWDSLVKHTAIFEYFFETPVKQPWNKHMSFKSEIFWNCFVNLCDKFSNFLACTGIGDEMLTTWWGCHHLVKKPWILMTNDLKPLLAEAPLEVACRFFGNCNHVQSTFRILGSNGSI